MKSFVVGAIVGGIAAALLAPRRGEETREMVRSAMEQWQAQAKGEVESLRTEMQARLDEIRAEVAGGRDMSSESAEDPILTSDKPYAAASEPFVASDSPYAASPEPSESVEESLTPSEETSGTGKVSPRPEGAGAE